MLKQAKNSSILMGIREKLSVCTLTLMEIKLSQDLLMVQQEYGMWPLVKTSTLSLAIKVNSLAPNSISLENMQ
jgi:hypothetical protein